MYGNLEDAVRKVLDEYRTGKSTSVEDILESLAKKLGQLDYEDHYSGDWV